MESNNIIKEDKNEIDYWLTQALLVTNNLNISDENNNIFPVKYSVKNKAYNCKLNNLELIEDLSI